MAVLKADAGYSVLIINGGEWDVENVRRVPVIAWSLDNNGMLMPITPLPWVNVATEITIELPSGHVIACSRKHGEQSNMFDSVEAYVEFVRAIIARTPPAQPTAEVTQH